jgi:hypothetical protein
MLLKPNGKPRQGISRPRNPILGRTLVELAGIGRRYFHSVLDVVFPGVALTLKRLNAGRFRSAQQPNLR